MATINKTSKKIEERELSADITSLFKLITESLYSSKEIFLRELVSNASDALDKLRIKSATNKALVIPSADFAIHVIPSSATLSEEVDSNAPATLTIKDNGYGMTEEDLINCLSKIAHSGTKDFLNAMKENITDNSLIGQFGVGFFSAFLVADKVIVKTFPVCEGLAKEGFVWTSTGEGTYTLEKIENSPVIVDGKEEYPCGTEITLVLKEKEKKWAGTDLLKTTLKKYNSFASYPIRLHCLKEEEVEEEPEQKEGEEEKKEEDAQVEEIKDEEEKEEDKPAKKMKKVKKLVEEKINTVKPLWKRKKEDITEEEYAEFYKEISNDWDKHMAVKHVRVDGGITFCAVLFIPSRPPFDMFEKKKKKNIRLYVKGVFIMDDCEVLVPEWLNFVVGIIESEDLNLNVSREILQKNKVARSIKQTLTKKCIELFKELCEDEEKGSKLMQNFGKQIKLGVHEDDANREELSALLTFESSQRKKVSLDNYIESMEKSKEAFEDLGKNIYFIAAENKSIAERSPFLEGFKAAGVEVLFFLDNIDEYVVQKLREYKGFTLTNITKQGVKVPKKKASEEEKKKSEEEKKAEEEKNKAFFEAVKNCLGEKVDSVVEVEHLHSSPASVMSPEYGWSANLERIMKSQALQDNTMHQFMMGRRILGLNMKHPIIQKLREIDTGSKVFKEKARLVFLTACLSCGFPIDENASELSSGIYKLLGNNMGVEEAEEVSVEEGEEGKEEKKDEEEKVEEVVQELD